MQAVELISRGTRQVGVLSYGWLVCGQPDPAGARFTVLQRTLHEQRHIVAIFWEYASLLDDPHNMTLPSH